jgi:hypothetical protein
MSDPICPIHQKPMRAGKFGWYCSTKDGENWCSQKVPFPKKEAASSAPPAAPPVGATAPVASPANAKAMIACAALEFAGRIYQGAGNEAAAAMAIDLAKMAATVMMQDGDHDISF